jgi:hypothetical protein
MLLRARGSLSELGGSGGEEAWAEGAAAGRKGPEGHPRSLSHFVNVMYPDLSVWRCCC